MRSRILEILAYHIECQGNCEGPNGHRQAADEIAQLVCDKMVFAFSKAIQYYEKDFPRLLEPHGFTSEQISNAIKKLNHG